jgi:hypothetical protein
VAHPGLIYETHGAFQDPSSYIQIVVRSTLHDADSQTIEQGT